MTRLLSMVAGWRGYAILAAAMLAIGFGSGWTVRDWKAGAEAAKAAKAETKQAVRVIYRERAQADVTSAVETKAVEAQVQIRTVTRTIVERIPIYVTPDADDRCVVPVGFVRVHDAAATGNPLPEPSGEPDGGAAASEASTVTLSWLAEVTADNYGTYQTVARQLSDLQDWIRQQQAVTNAP
jgi:hypothetical protein